DRWYVEDAPWSGEPGWHATYAGARPGDVASRDRGAATSLPLAPGRSARSTALSTAAGGVARAVGRPADGHADHPRRPLTALHHDPCAADAGIRRWRTGDRAAPCQYHSPPRRLRVAASAAEASEPGDWPDNRQESGTLHGSTAATWRRRPCADAGGCATAL